MSLDIRTVYKNWGRVLMIVAMTCNIMSGMKVYCMAARMPSPFLGASLIASDVSLDSSLAGNDGASDKQSVHSGSKAPRCTCKKTRSCSAVSRAILTSNPLQRFNDEQRNARSEGIDIRAIGEEDAFSKWRCGPAPVIEGRKGALTLYDDPLSLACILII